jgi:hypothetical protein
VLDVPPAVAVPEVGAWDTTLGATKGDIPSPAISKSWEVARAIVSEALKAPATRAALVPCQLSASTCLETVIGRIGRRAFRRPLSSAELTRWTAVARRTASESNNDAWKGLELALTGLLQSPKFLYRVETGDGRSHFTSFELASRASHFLWAQPPDDELLDLATTLDVADTFQVEQLVDKMLNDPRSLKGSAKFLVELFGVDALLTQDKNGMLFPGFGDRRQAMRDSLVATGVAALQSDGFSGLLTTRKVFINQALAALYDKPATALGMTLEAVDTDRLGLLTTPAFLALNSYKSTTSPALRGLFVRKKLLCHDIPPPPIGVSTVLPTLDRLVTKRELVAVHQTDMSCAGCHRLMDPIGLGLENFDAVGAYRQQENGLPIDPSGTLDGKTFSDSKGLSEILATHDELAPCLTAQWLSQGLGTGVTPGDAVITAALSQGQPQSLKAFLKAMVLSPAFRAFATSTTGGAP